MLPFLLEVDDKPLMLFSQSLLLFAASYYQKLISAKLAAKSVLNTLNNNDYVGIIVFSDESYVVGNYTNLV